MKREPVCCWYCATKFVSASNSKLYLILIWFCERGYFKVQRGNFVSIVTQLTEIKVTLKTREPVSSILAVCFPPESACSVIWPLDHEEIRNHVTGSFDNCWMCQGFLLSLNTFIRKKERKKENPSRMAFKMTASDDKPHLLAIYLEIQSWHKLRPKIPGSEDPRLSSLSWIFSACF